MLGVITWDVDPVIFSLGSIAPRWYGLLFALGLLILGPMIEERIWKRERLPEEWMSQLYLYVVVGTVVGARLGHVLFYDPQYYLAHPIEILKIWEGGLASHGGTIGVILALYLYSKRISHRSLLWILDRIAVPTGLVAAFIRLGNLMNSEIFGRPTDLDWAFRFPRSGEYRHLAQGLPELLNPSSGWGCHPTQLYEAGAYLLVFALSMWLYWRRHMAQRYEGVIIGVFLVLVFGARLVIEHIKIVQEPWEEQLVASIGLNMGQLLSIPFVLVGLGMVLYALRHPVVESSGTSKSQTAVR